MDEKAFAAELDRAKYFMRCDADREEFWIGYHKGLHRAHDGENFGSESEHNALMSIPDDEPDFRRRMKGQGYRAGINAFETGNCPV